MNPKDTTTLDLKRREYDGTAVVELKGKLTLGEGSRALRKMVDDLAAEGRKTALLDLGALSYMDSSGLGTLVTCHNVLKPQGIRLIKVPARIQELLTMSRLSTIFPVFDDEPAAIRSFQP